MCVFAQHHHDLRETQSADFGQIIGQVVSHQYSLACTSVYYHTDTHIPFNTGTVSISYSIICNKQGGGPEEVVQTL